MTPRERLQLAYEIAFFPPRLNQLWSEYSKAKLSCEQTDFEQALTLANQLQLALPESGYASQRALTRLALFQARSRAYGMPGFIRAVRRRLHLAPITDTHVPGHLVRDISLPPYYFESTP
jgi:hypothetical protein